MVMNHGCLIVKIHHSTLCWLCQDNLAIGKQLLPQCAVDHIEDGSGGIMVLEVVLWMSLEPMFVVEQTM